MRQRPSSLSVLAAISSGVVAFLGLTLSTATLAQEEEASAPASSGGGVDQIVVTAEFRETNLQDTPIAITAVTGDMMEARSQTNIFEVAAQAPNVTLKPQGQENGNGIIAFIRGVGQTDFNYALEPGVGIYVDDVYYPTLTGSLLDLMDLERVEILRGPQGTLAGKNSIGGAIKLFSSKPSGETRGSIQATYGSYDRLEFRGFADFPVIEDKLFARIAGVSKNQDGYVKRLDYALTHPGSDVPTLNNGQGELLGTLGGKSYTAARLSLRWVPSDTVEVNLAGDFTNDNSEAGAQVEIYANKPGTTADGLPWLPDSMGNAIPFDCRFVPYGQNSCDTITGYDRKYITYGTFLDPTPANSQSPYKPLSLDPISHLDSYGVQGSVDWQVSDTFSVKLISSWREYQSEWTHDADGSPVPVLMLQQNLDHWQWSQELRLSGVLADDMIDYTIGGFWFEQGGTLQARVDLPYAGIDFIHGPDSTPSTSKAAFSHVAIHLTDALNVSGGVRYTKDWKEYTYFRSNPDGTIPSGPCEFFLGAPIAGPTAVGNSPNCLLFTLYNVTDTFRGDRLDWRASVDYRFTPSLLAYASASTGYKGGGVNPRPFFLNQIQPFNPETLTSYEVGFKTDLFDDTLRVNVAGFYNKYNDVILTLFACPTSPCQQPNNVGKADVKGFEVETLFRPTDAFTFDGSVSYLDFKYKELDASANVGALTLDMVTPYTPEWKASFGLQYEVPNVFGGTLTPRFDGSYQSSIFTQPINYDNIPVVTTDALGMQYITNKIDAYFLGNARITWRSADEDWSIAVEVQNLFDEYYYYHLYEQSGSPGHISATPGMPRTWAVTIKRDF